MIPDFCERTSLLLGDGAVEKLTKARVAVFGVGGVGGYCVEALARAGVGALDLIDGDTVSLSNLNRQIIALRSTVGRYKTEVFAERIADVNPACKVTAHNVFVLPETVGEFDFSKYDYVVDAIDTVSGKIAIIEAAKKAGVPIVSAMGAGRKLDPTAFRVADLSKTSVCPLARVMRTEMRKRGIQGVKVVYSEEEAIPQKTAVQKEEDSPKKQIPGSVSFVPSVMGMILAGEVIKDLISD